MNNGMKISAGQSGFTLIEVVIYVALLGMLLAGAITAAFSLADGSEKNLKALHIREEAAFIEEKIDWALTNAISASVSENGSVLTIRRMSGDDFDAAENPIVVYLEDSALMMRRAYGAPLTLNATAFPVSEFHVEISTVESYRRIMIRFEIDDAAFTASYSIKL